VYGAPLARPAGSSMEAPMAREALPSLPLLSPHPGTDGAGGAPGALFRSAQLASYFESYLPYLSPGLYGGGYPGYPATTGMPSAAGGYSGVIGTAGPRDVGVGAADVPVVAGIGGAAGAAGAAGASGGGTGIANGAGTVSDPSFVGSGGISTRGLAHDGSHQTQPPAGSVPATGDTEATLGALGVRLPSSALFATVSHAPAHRAAASGAPRPTVSGKSLQEIEAELLAQFPAFGSGAGGAREEGLCPPEECLPLPGLDDGASDASGLSAESSPMLGALGNGVPRTPLRQGVPAVEDVCEGLGDLTLTGCALSSAAGAGAPGPG